MSPRGISPVARRLAEEHGVDLAGLQGSGPGGRIIKRDVLAVVGRAPSKAHEETVRGTGMADGLVEDEQEIEVTAMRRTIARRLVESKTTIPHFTVTVAVDASNLLAARRLINDRLDDRELYLSVNDFVV